MTHIIGANGKSDSRPLVAVCCPSSGSVKSGFASSLAAMMYSSGGAVKFILAFGGSSIVTVSRDLCVEQSLHVEQMAIDMGKGQRIDYFMWLDTDIIFPPMTLLSLINRARGGNLSVIGATYVRRHAPYDIMVATLDGKSVQVESGLLEVASIPLGCCLMKRDVVAALPRPYFRLRHDDATGKTFGEDVTFFETIRGMGHRVWLDIDMTREIGHIAEQPLMVQGDQLDIQPYNSAELLAAEQASARPN